MRLQLFGHYQLKTRTEWKYRSFTLAAPLAFDRISVCCRAATVTERYFKFAQSPHASLAGTLKTLR